MDKSQKPKTPKTIKQKNLIEAFKDIGSSTAQSLKSDILRPQDFLEQILNFSQSEKKYSGEINPGESLEINDVFTGKRDEEIKLQQQLALEQKLREEEKIQTEKKSNELKLQLNALIQEVSSLARSTQNLTQEVEIAAMQAPIEPGVYHIVFFEKLLEFIKSFREKVEDSSIWLSSLNKRAQKKNYWSSYKQHKGKFLLSPDHYLSRSAG